MHIKSVAQIIDDLVDGWIPEQGWHDPFIMRCIVIRDRPPRDRFFDYIRDLGSELIDDAFSGKIIDQTNPYFIFPERHMSVGEQQLFILQLAMNQGAPQMGMITVVTSCPVIISDFYGEQVRIVVWPEDGEEKIDVSNND